MKSLCGESNCDCGYTIELLVKALEELTNVSASMSDQLCVEYCPTGHSGKRTCDPPEIAQARTTTDKVRKEITL